MIRNFLIAIKASLLRQLTSSKERTLTGNDLKEIKKVLFFRYDKIGDMIITTPVFRELKLAYPNIKITVLASKNNKSIILNNPYVDSIFLNNKHNFFSDISDLIKLRKQRFDLCIEFDHSVIPHAILRLKIIKPKMIFSVQKDGRYGVQGKDLRIYNLFTEKEKNEHARVRWLNTLKPLKVMAKSLDYEIYLDISTQQKAKTFVKKFYGKLIIGINLEGDVEGKKIPFKSVGKLIENINSDFSDIVFLMFCKPTTRANLMTEVKKLGAKNVFLTYETKTILDVAAIIKEIQMVITPDTSIVHIASTYDKPVVSIHEMNSDSFHLFAPVSNLSETIFSPSQKSILGYSEKELYFATKKIIHKLRFNIED